MQSLSQIRNVAFVGINHSGKTSLVESILHLTGQITRRGKIGDGTMTTDYEPESVARQITTSTSFARTVYDGITFNIIDCPGFVDFCEEAKLALLGADAAVFVVEPDAHRIIQMDSLLAYTEAIGIARLVFINKLDKHDVSIGETLEALKALPGKKVPKPVAPLEYPILTNDGIIGYVDVLKKEAFKYGEHGKPEEIPMPPLLQAEFDSARDKLVEAIADTDDEVLELVMEGQEPPFELMERDLKKSVCQGIFVPIVVGSAHSDAGVISLLDTLIELAPAPDERQYKDKEGKAIELKDDGPVVAQVLKTYVHPQSGKLSVVRVISGTITHESHLVDSTRQGHAERLGGLYFLQGKKHENLDAAGPGTICALARMEIPHTGDTLVSEKTSTVLAAPPAPPPLYSLAISPVHRNDEAKLSTLLAKLIEEDPLLKVDRDPDTNEYCLYGQGDVHLTLARQRLERKYNIQLESKRPQIAHKETIAVKADAHGRHKKQTGGRGQFGEVYLRLEPLERGKGNQFLESVVGGSVPRQYIPGVEKGVMEALMRGPLAGFPVVDVSVNLYDGSFHEVDSDEMSFKMAGILAMREGLQKAHPFILEPITEVVVAVPNAHTSGVLAQITGRRGQILGYEASTSRSGWDEVTAYMPQEELWDYIIELRTLTQGLGYYTWKFAHLAPVPPALSQKLIAEATVHSHGES